MPSTSAPWPLRSVLFVPADSERKLARAAQVPADALVLDLEDSVLSAQKDSARQRARAFLDHHATARSSQLWVRINALGTPLALADLAAIVGGRPDGIMLPKAAGPRDVERLSHHLEALEAREGLSGGAIGILPLATETPSALFALGEYARVALPRLLGLSWGAEDLSAAIGAQSNKGADGAWDAPYRWVRSQCLFAAHAAGVQAIDTLYADYEDIAGLRADCLHSYRQGFGGRLAIHPKQIEIINAAYTPSAEDAERARRIVAAFAAQPGSGVVGLDGQMFDIPHLKRAEALLARYVRRAAGHKEA